MSLKNEKVITSGMSAGTDNGQPLSHNSMVSIPDKQSNINEIMTGNTSQNDSMTTSNLYAISLTEIYDTTYQPKKQIVEELFCSGVYLFVGAPKVGKSFFVAQLGYYVSCGLDLWDLKTNKGIVLYLALEDGYARLQKRLSKMFGMETVDDFYFATEAKNLKQGLDGQLDEFMKDHPETTLIIIDTLQKIKEVGGDKYSYSNDYEIVTAFKRFADKHNICVLLVHHTRKQSSEDCFDTISGTTGLLGAADGAFILQKEKRTANKAILDITSRDFQDQRLHLEFDRERCLWILVKRDSEVWKEPPDPVLEKIDSLLTEEKSIWVGSASDLLVTLEIENMKPNALSRHLNAGAERLWNDYKIRIESARSHAGRWVKLTKE